MQYDRTGFELPRSGIVAIEDQLRAIGEPAGIQVEFTGEAENAPPTQGISDLIGLLAAFVILMVLFRALVPTVIPLLFAIVAVLGAFLLLFLAARLTHFNTITEILVPMIGLGVGIDYTLFIVTRFRQFLHDGLSPQEAAAAAGATAGRAVHLRRRHGRDLDHRPRIDRPRLHHEARHRQRARRPDRRAARELACCRPCWPCSATRSTAAVSACGRSTSRARDRRARRSQRGAASSRATRRIVLPVVIVVLLLLASPVLAVRLGLADAGTAPKDQTTRKAYDLLSKGFGPGFTEPIPIVVDLRSDHTAAEQLEAALKSVPGITQVDAPIYNAKTAERRRSRSSTPTAGTSRRTRRPTTSSRRCGTPSSRRRSRDRPAHAYVSGSNAAFTDIGNRIFSRAPWFLLYIIGITFLVLAMAFRSAVVAIKAALTTLISALVGFGVLTFVVQLGPRPWALIGLDRTGPIESFVPPIAFAILFGLSMDYEVFLMSRIREEHVHGSDTVDGRERRRRRRRPGDRRRGADHVLRLLLVPARPGPRLEGVRPAARGRDPDRRVPDATDAVPALLTLLGERSW